MRKSNYSRWVGRIPRPIRWIAHVLLYPAFALYAVLHLIALERWPHFAWSDDVDEHAEEYAPAVDKTRRWFPPLFFDGYFRRVKR